MRNPKTLNAMMTRRPILGLLVGALSPTLGLAGPLPDFSEVTAPENYFTSLAGIISLLIASVIVIGVWVHLATRARTTPRRKRRQRRHHTQCLVGWVTTAPLLRSGNALAALPETGPPSPHDDVLILWGIGVLFIAVIAAACWLCRGLDKTARPAGPTSDERAALIWLIRRLEEMYPTLVALKRVTAEAAGQDNPYAATVREIGHIRTNLSLRLNHLTPPLADDQSPDSHAKSRLKETL